MSSSKNPPCGCQKMDPFGDLPPELRPRKQKQSDLRKATCPTCGLVYWTNRDTDVCMACEKKALSQSSP
jgi:hypothetical protein